MVGYAEVFALDTSAAWAASRHYRYDDVVFVCYRPGLTSMSPTASDG